MSNSSLKPTPEEQSDNVEKNVPKVTPEDSKDTVDSTPQTLKKKSNKGLYALVFLLFIFLLILSLGFGYLLMENEKLKSEIISIKNTEVVVKVDDEVVAVKETKEVSKTQDLDKMMEAEVPESDGFSEVSPDSNYKKTFVNSSDLIYGKIPYPTEILALTQDNTVGLNCTPRYSRIGDNEYVEIITKPDYSQEALPVEDAKTLKFAQRYNQEREKPDYLDDVRRCEIEDGRTLYIYGFVPKEHRSEGSSTHFQLISEGIPEGEPLVYSTDDIYFGCHDPLGLSVNDELYYSCGSGDGGGSKTYIMKFDLKTRSAGELYHCTYLSSSITENEIATVECSDGLKSDINEPIKGY